LNAGQTCIGVDYVLVQSGLMGRFATAAVAAAQRYYPDGGASPQYTAIRGDRDRQRLEAYVEEARAAGVRIVPLFRTEGQEGRMTPVLLIDPPEHLKVMRDEIFGPILPVKPYTTLEDAIGYVNGRARALALYLFTRDRATVDALLRRTVSGAVCVNDTLSHIAADNLPFGGVGMSGMGHYHGREGFDRFSKLKPVLARRWPGIAGLLRPPYGKRHAKLLRWMIGG
jgi:coniferyl-aldehyde dehydrogenase